VGIYQVYLSGRYIPGLPLRWVSLTVWAPRWVSLTVWAPRWVSDTYCTQVGIRHLLHSGGYTRLPWSDGGYTRLPWSDGGYPTPVSLLVGILHPFHCWRENMPVCQKWLKDTRMANGFKTFIKAGRNSEREGGPLRRVVSLLLPTVSHFLDGFMQKSR